MSELPTFENYSKAPNERVQDFKFVLLMSVSGLFSGITSLAVGHAAGDFLFMVLGAPFGAVIACALAIAGIARIWKAIILAPLSAVAFYISLWVTSRVDINVQWKQWSMDGPPGPVSLFAGGMSGSFIVVAAALLIAYPRMRLGRLASRALPWAVLGGISGAVGWALGSTGLIVPNHNSGGNSNFQSVFVIWQIAMGVAMGVTLRPSQRNFLVSLKTLPTASSRTTPTLVVVLQA